MNKKATIGLSIAVGGMMLFTAAYGAFADSSGYSSYKSALKNTLMVKSVTPKIQVSVKDNGAPLIDLDTTMKVNRDSRSLSRSMTVTAGGQTFSADSYRQNGQTIMKNSDSDSYTLIQPDPKRTQADQEWDSKDLNSGYASDVENVIDALVGNLQNYITVQSNQDGSKDVAMHLSDSQIPPVANAAASMLIKNADREEHGRHTPSALENAIQQNMPKLVSDISITSSDITARINNDNLVENQTANITISGKDAGGASHDIVISVQAVMSDFNSTSPDTVDLTGKQVQTVQHEKMDR